MSQLDDNKVFESDMEEALETTGPSESKRRRMTSHEEFNEFFGYSDDNNRVQQFVDRPVKFKRSDGAEYTGRTVRAVSSNELAVQYFVNDKAMEKTIHVEALAALNPDFNEFLPSSQEIMPSSQASITARVKASSGPVSAEISTILEEEEGDIDESRKEKNDRYRQYLKEFKLTGCPQTLKMLKEMKAMKCCVYELGYFDADGNVIRIWFGVSIRPDGRFREHATDKTVEEKLKLFGKERGFMRILFVGSIEECLNIESLLINYRDSIPGTQLKNMDMKKNEFKFKSDCGKAVAQIIANGEKVNLNQFQDTAKFGESWKEFVLNDAECPDVAAFIEELKEEEHFVYVLEYYDKKEKKMIRFYYGCSNDPIRRLLVHPYEQTTPQKYQIFIKHRAQIYQKIVFKGTRGFCEFMEHVMIKESGEKNLVNVGKTVSEIPEMDFDFKLISEELMSRSKVDTSFMRVVDALRNEHQQLLQKKSRTKCHKRNSKDNQEDTIAQIRREDVQLKIPNEISASKRDQNLKILQKEPDFKTGFVNGGPLARRIVPDEDVIQPEDLPGTFLNMNYDQFEKLTADPQARLSFLARVGLIRNRRTCSSPNCTNAMALKKNGAKTESGYQWICGTGGKCCSTKANVVGTFFYGRLCGFSNFFPIMFLHSMNTPETEIYSAITNNQFKSPASTLISNIDDLIDEAVADNQSVNESKEDFLNNNKIDRFGIILYLIVKKFDINKY